MREYAQAERDDKVRRVKSESGLTPEEYVERLFNDGEAKGWLRES